MVTRPRVLIDTCVLYPTVMREMVLGVARGGAFEPIWSARILEEWARAAIKLGPVGEAQARAEIALLRSNWPGAERDAAPGLQVRLWLPDADDIHVLAVAVASSADIILTLNNKDFPRQILAEEGLSRADPDSYLHGIWQATPELVAPVAEAVLQEARRLSGEDWQMRALLKKARLPRLAKALG
jgi:predicted nucleic acid-binding protein